VCPRTASTCVCLSLLDLVLVLWLGSRVLAVCPSMCSCSHSHREADCSRRGLRKLPDGLQYNLRSLNLSHNRLHNLDEELAAYTHLRILDLSHNRLSRLSNRIQLLDKNDTVYQWNLRMLDLSSNKLERAIFINNTLTSLCTLNLSHNQFWTLPTNLPVLLGSLDRLPRLTHFYLHANRFSTLPFGVLDKMTSLRVISLGSNPWACHLYADISYLISWTKRTPARVLGCPCHTQPVCGGVHPDKTGGWHFASYNLPPLATSAVDLSSMTPEASVTGWWYLPASTLLSTPHTPKETWDTQHHTFTPTTSISMSRSTDLTINRLSATVNRDSLHISEIKETSTTDSAYTTDTSSFSDSSLLREMTGKGDTTFVTDQFFTTESLSIQTKKTTTLRTRSVRRQNHSLPGGIRNSSPALVSCFLLFFLHNSGFLSLILVQVL
uniref:Oligodendrocyte myelin glycoprotein a n=1 Tax=Amphilophus citrinellus TaxID=61819 RepID=A0A3Q0RQQ1_AMPCI